MNGVPISGEQFARHTESAIFDNSMMGHRQLVTFDLMTALAFCAFRDSAVEAQVIEVAFHRETVKQLLIRRPSLVGKAGRRGVASTTAG